MSKLQRVFKQLSGGIYIPEEVQTIKGKTLLHISDTPQIIFSSLRKLIDHIQPDYIVHTGDMVDNIKLELFPYKANEYTRSLKKLNWSLSVCPHSKLLIALGNHDIFESVNNTFREALIYTEPTQLTLEGKIVLLSHYPPEVQSIDDKVDICLFGHDVTVHSQVKGQSLILNGIENIHLIELETLRTIALDYPSGTNDSRLRKRKIGI